MLCFLLLQPWLLAAEDLVKIQVAERQISQSGIKEIFLRNLAEEEEIYFPTSIEVSNNHLFFTNNKPLQLVKTDLAGKTIATGGLEGEGPGEFASCFSIRKNGDKLVFADFFLKKILTYSTRLRYINEFKLSFFSSDLVINQKREIIICLGLGTDQKNYLGVFDQTGIPLRRFGERKYNFTNAKSNPDRIFCLAYDSEKNELWGALLHRYELRCYRGTTLRAVINEKEDFFRKYKKKDQATGRILTEYRGKPLNLQIMGNKLLYFYRLDIRCFCDIFDRQTLQIVRRIRLKNFYWKTSRYNNETLYAINHGNHQDATLYRLELMTN